MYFASRVQAGRMLASQLLEKYRYENCAVVALDDGGVVVGAEIAAQLHCVLMLLSSSEITLPRELEAIGAIAQDGTFSYNSGLSEGDINEITGEFRGFIEQEKLHRLSELHRLVGSGGEIDKALLRGRNIILVSEGFKEGFALDLAYQYLKPVASEKVIVATPLASTLAVDHMHILADEIYCLSVLENYMHTSHYYDADDIPDHAKLTEMIEKIILQWK